MNRHYKPGPLTRVALLAPDFSGAFWPHGWMVYACAGLGAFDVSLIAYIVHGVVAR